MRRPTAAEVRECPQCGPVQHQPIPEDDFHCECMSPDWEYWENYALGVRRVCDCECHR